VFGEHGFDVTGSDIAPLAIQSAIARYGHLAKFHLKDCLNPPEELHGQFDVVIEHTFFCAIDPALREDYVRAVGDVLKPGGRLFGIFWLHGQPGGPPFDASKLELERLFSEKFTWLGFEPNPWPVASRKPQEWLLGLSRK
jgi:SAM-dependent methyltransferase